MLPRRASPSGPPRSPSTLRPIFQTRSEQKTTLSDPRDPGYSGAERKSFQAGFSVGWLATAALLALRAPLFAQGPLIYGYLSCFPAQTAAISSNEVAWLSQYHVNYVQTNHLQ